MIPLLGPTFGHTCLHCSHCHYSQTCHWWLLRILKAAVLPSGISILGEPSLQPAGKAELPGAGAGLLRSAPLGERICTLLFQPQTSLSAAGESASWPRLVIVGSPAMIAPEVGGLIAVVVWGGLFWVYISV